MVIPKVLKKLGSFSVSMISFVLSCWCKSMQEGRWEKKVWKSCQLLKLDPTNAAQKAINQVFRPQCPLFPFRRSGESQVMIKPTNFFLTNANIIQQKTFCQRRILALTCLVSNPLLEELRQSARVSWDLELKLNITNFPIKWFSDCTVVQKWNEILVKWQYLW